MYERLTPEQRAKKIFWKWFVEYLQRNDKRIDELLAQGLTKDRVMKQIDKENAEKWFAGELGEIRGDTFVWR